MLTDSQRPDSLRTPTLHSVVHRQRAEPAATSNVYCSAYVLPSSAPTTRTNSLSRSSKRRTASWKSLTTKSPKWWS